MTASVPDFVSLNSVFMNTTSFMDLYQVFVRFMFIDGFTAVAISSIFYAFQTEGILVCINVIRAMWLQLVIAGIGPFFLLSP